MWLCGHTFSVPLSDGLTWQFLVPVSLEVSSLGGMACTMVLGAQVLLTLGQQKPRTSEEPCTCPGWSALTGTFLARPSVAAAASVDLGLCSFAVYALIVRKSLRKDF